MIFWGDFFGTPSPLKKKTIENITFHCVIRVRNKKYIYNNFNKFTFKKKIRNHNSNCI